ncbi:hypothetical protein [Qipengyuania sp. NPDC077563]|uniref:hypothetical protein n=1 Tax=Qipengyuania sp. NPDC077563 TaxID=3364497 RepID=UPI00384D6B14
MFRGIVARFKKAGDDGFGCNIPTQAAMAFMDAETPLPGFPAKTAKIELIWEPNEIWTQVERVLVVARDGDRLLWEYEVSGEPMDDTAFTINPTGHDDGSDEMDDTDLIRPKAKPQAEPKAR